MSSLRIDEIMSTFIYIYELSCEYLGSVTTQKYWKMSCPNKNLLQQFSLNNPKIITFEEDLNQPISQFEEVLFQEWLEKFTNICSNTINVLINIKN